MLIDNTSSISYKSSTTRFKPPAQPSSLPTQTQKRDTQNAAVYVFPRHYHHPQAPIASHLKQETSSLQSVPYAATCSPSPLSTAGLATASNVAPAPTNPPSRSRSSHDASMNEKRGKTSSGAPRRGTTRKRPGSSAPKTGAQDKKQPFIRYRSARLTSP